MDRKLTKISVNPPLDEGEIGEKVDDEYMLRQAPLRAAWLDESLPQEERDVAGAALKALIYEMSVKITPLTGIFTYTQEQVDEARKAGF